MRLVLASASPRRAELLRRAGFVFDTLVVDVDESVRPGETPSEYVRRLAMEKSACGLDVLAGLKTRPTTDIARTTNVGQDFGPASDDLVVLGADTAVVVDDAILGKPWDDASAAAMVRRLSGRAHEVLTGISLRAAGWELGRVIATTVELAAMTETDVGWYVKSGEGRDKAGGYAIQGLASRFVRRIDGSYTNVVGLPIAAVHELLAEIASRPSSRLS
jgi:septum formation protein